MRKLGWWVVAVAMVAACKKQGDDCERAVDKLVSYFHTVKGGEMKADERTEALTECREAMKDPKDHDADDIKCVLAASDNAAIARCLGADEPAKPDQLEDYAKDQETKSEAKLQLTKLGKLAKVAFVETSAFPVGTAATLPADKCCSQPGQRCPNAHDAFAADKVWSELDFSVDDPGFYRYAYTGTTTAFTATAVGDLDCDGSESTWTLVGSVTNGMPVVATTPPAAGVK